MGHILVLASLGLPRRHRNKHSAFTFYDLHIVKHETIIEGDCYIRLEFTVACNLPHTDVGNIHAVLLAPVKAFPSFFYYTGHIHKGMGLHGPETLFPQMLNRCISSQFISEQAVCRGT
jgi:hypothetical protein